MGQTSTQTTTNTVPRAQGNEAALMNLLAKLAKSSAGQLGDLSGLAQGKVGGPSAEDLALVQQSIGRTGDMAQRELQRVMGPMLAQIMETQGGRGITGGSIDSLNRALAGREMSDQLAKILGGAQQQGGEALLNLPFQRANTTMGANQLLFNMLTGAANPVLANSLQERLSSGTSTTQTKSPPNWAEIGKTVGAIGAAPFTGGASLMALGIPVGGGQQSGMLPPMPNPYTGRY